MGPAVGGTGIGLRPILVPVGAIRVGVFGAAGRMGSAVRAAVEADPELELVATVGSGDDPAAMAAAEVAVDFTNAGAARANLSWCAGHGVHAVSGTTGLGAADLERLRAAFGSSNCVVAPNFAVGAVLMMRFAELAAPHFETAEIVELHHDRKADAPSGTALLTAERMAAARSGSGAGEWGADPTRADAVALPGARGGLGPAGVRVHSVRLRGLVAHQEVLLGTEGQTLTLRHDSYDRASFMPGVVLAVKRVAALPGLTVGLDAVLGL